MGTCLRMFSLINMTNLALIIFRDGEQQIKRLFKDLFHNRQEIVEAF